MKNTFRIECLRFLKSSRFAVCASVVLLGFIVAGCPGGRQKPEVEPDGKIVIRGSNTIGEELAPRLIAEYKKEHPAIGFDLESKATGYGLASLASGQCDIAGASRLPISGELFQAQSRGVQMNEYVIGSYSVAVVVNSGNPVGNLTTNQVRDIFTGTVQNWKELGGPDAPIHLYVRDPISGTHLGFREVAMENKPYALGPKTFTNYVDIVQAVAQDANGIGYSSIELASKDGIKGVSIGGVSPTVASVNQGKYPYSRILRFYTNKAKERSSAHDFIQFVLAAHGQEILTEMGYVPHP
ncbi:MAG TPA: phosphate ABC transporter substrate-binding protein [Verrucomicrobiae bacterium]|nr:phosphate ABC transporter substrate-binding protein [Verrucomicrobiae bacterium]